MLDVERESRGVFGLVPEYVKVRPQRGVICLLDSVVCPMDQLCDVVFSSFIRYSRDENPVQMVDITICITLSVKCGCQNALSISSLSTTLPQIVLCHLMPRSEDNYDLLCEWMNRVGRPSSL